MRVVIPFIITKIITKKNMTVYTPLHAHIKMAVFTSRKFRAARGLVDLVVYTVQTSKDNILVAWRKKNHLE